MENLLEIKNVSKKYTKFTLNDISFSIPKGSIVGFIGRNGAGKSTTLKGIMNLVHFDSGEVIAFDKSMKENKEIVGTLEYIAPEVINSVKYDYSADIYSLGIIC